MLFLLFSSVNVKEPSEFSSKQDDSRRAFISNLEQAHACFQRALVSIDTCLFETLCASWYHLYKLKNVENTLRGVLLLVKLQTWSLKMLALLHRCFSRFLKFYKWYQIAQNITFYPNCTNIK